MKFRTGLLIAFILVTVSGVKVLAADKFVTPAGSGGKDGSSWENALQGDKAGGMQTAFDSLGEGGILYVGSGTYSVVQTITVTDANEGSDLAPKTVQGVDTGNGLPYFKGAYSLLNTNNQTDFFVADAGASHWRVRDISISNYRNGVHGLGGNVDCQMTGLKIREARRCIYLEGGGSETTLAQAAVKQYAADGTQDVLIEDCEVSGYSQRGIHIMGGCHDVMVRRCRADGGGQEGWITNNFPIGFQVAASEQDANRNEDRIVFDYNIFFYDCVSENNYHQDGDSYWNADGFASERASDNVRFYRCVASDNTDGGWDVKSKSVYLFDCVSTGNKRGFRLWSEELAELNNCIAAYSRLHGGSVSQCGLWTSSEQDGYPAATVVLNNCTLYNNDREQVRNGGIAEGTGNPSSITLNNCIIGFDYTQLDTSNTRLYYNNNLTGITRTDCVEYTKTSSATNGVYPDFKNPVKTWEGWGKDWNSLLYNGTKGYHTSSEGIKVVSTRFYTRTDYMGNTIDIPLQPEWDLVSGDVKAQVVFQNEDSRNLPAAAICAVYDESEDINMTPLVTASLWSGVIPPKTFLTAELTAAVEDGQKSRMLFWDSFDNLKPLIPALDKKIVKFY